MFMKKLLYNLEVIKKRMLVDRKEKDKYMSNRLLTVLYKDIFEKKPDKNSFDDRLKLQKLVYLLEEAGRNVGDYNFSWYKHGPYSQKLQYDILDINEYNQAKNINYTEESKIVMKAIKKLIEAKKVYTTEERIETVSSLLYLKKYMTSLNKSDKDLINIFETKKPNLRDTNENYNALNALREYSKDISERTYFG